ncbi:MAG: Coenzyme F420 hydrogenase/dehydrogenase, beta subunit C-terminal domain [Candidatus Heimdallarchaeota archaeon]|nr:Coenzyme F420 hydrogenase/dehydrogenase, beta subunit C-terminal domain [Candidatus Heimdallarchaeota archaeon]MCK4878889.1 Coenzyme F420 hydrogenase/dehydrogenase, beta subunit C-terminal domain [Candidatus Heimdallarchaeota archaeon]
MSKLSLIKDVNSEFEKIDSNIRTIFNNRWCNYCGACYLVCPVDAISYEDGIISINDDCIFCQKCLDACSQNQKYRYTEDFQGKERNTKVLKIEPKMKKIPFGEIIDIYNCKSGRRDRKEFAMVGGTVTSLLECSLKEQIVDGVIAIDFSSGKILPSPKLIINPDDLLKAAGSRYLPTFSLEILKELNKIDNISTVAIVTLPCQAYAIDKLRNNKETEELTKKIKLVITLLCGNGLPSRDEVAEFLSRSDLNLENRNFKAYREKSTSRPYLNPMNRNRYVYEENSGKRKSFASKRVFRSKGERHCGNICPDYTGVASDISVGGSGISRNIVITRTKEGEKTVSLALEKGYLIKLDKFSKLNRMIVNFMGNYKREEIRKAFQKIFS